MCSFGKNTGRCHDARSSLTEALAHSMASGQLTAEELLQQYCTLVYAQTGNYEETARRVQLDRRTVKSKIDASLLQRLRATL